MSKNSGSIPKPRFRGVLLQSDHDRHLRQIAAERDCSVSDVMRDALETYLDKQPVLV
jgi:predicted transcriptional regulator